MKKKSKIYDENNKNSKIRTRTTPTALFNAMAILNGGRKKCLDEIGFGSMIGMRIHELPGKLGFYVIDNLDTETNVLSLTDNSILLTSQSGRDILRIPMGGCSLESLAPRSPNDPFIKEWLSQFGDKNEVRPNDITDGIVSTKDAGKLFKMNFLIVDDDGKQDVVMDEIDIQNTEDVCKEPPSIHENKCVEIRLTFNRHAWIKKSVMDNENKNAEAVELSSSIKRCGHPMKHSYNLDVKDQDYEETPFEFVDRKDEQTVHKADTSKNVNEKCTSEENEQNNDDSELSNNADAKSENEDEEFDALAITICNVCHPFSLRVLMLNENLNDFLEIINIEDSESKKEEFDFVGDTDNEEKYDPKKDANYKDEFYKSPYELKPIEPKICVSASEKLVTDTLFAIMYKPREIVFKTYEGFKVLAIEMKTLATGLDVHYEVINAWCDVLNTIEKDMKDYDKTMRKYCFKTGFLQANFLDKNVDANMKVKNFEKKLKEAVNNDTTLMKLQHINFSFVLIKNNCVENDSADRDLGITKALQANFLNKNVDANMKVKNFEKKLKEAVNYDTTLMKLQQIQLVFFPICFSQHFYVICFDLQSGSFVLIENNCVENDSSDRDLGITNALHYVFVDFLQSIENKSYKKLRRAKLEVVKLDFKKRNDYAMCGIIVMTAMDCYMGKVKKLKDMFLEGIPYTQLVNLRQMIATKIMMSKINIR
nr:hypothetical protein [Tanacetum cinerariifolium]